MTIKISATAANQYLSVPDAANLTFPTGDWALSWVTVFDGATTGNPQYLLSTGAYNTAGSLNLIYQPVAPSAGFSANMMQVSFDNGGTNSGALTRFLSGAYQFTLQHSDGNLILRSCQIRSTAPTDGTGVVTEFTTASAQTLDGAGGLVIGGRTDLTTTRFADQSIGRFSLIAARLTDFEVAKLAYGMEITDIGKSPLWYVRMDTATDTNDRGSLGLTVTPHGTLVAGTAPGFGYAAAAVAPAITGAPTVSSATVGTVVTATPASVSGTPTPTRTWQWYINAVAVSGATASAYTPVSGDATKTLTVTQTETNTQGVANATSTGVVVAAAAAANAVTVAAAVADRVYQRVSAAAVVAMSGTYTGTVPTSVEYQLYAADGATVLVAWTAIAGATISGGVWSGSPSIAQGGMYRRCVRAKSGTSVLATSSIDTNTFGVGANFLVMGSSSAEYYFTYDSGTYTPGANVRLYNGAWGPMGTYGCATQMANSFATQLGVPVGMLSYGKGGTTLADWLASGNTYFAAATAAVAACGGKLEGVIISAGSNDAANGIVTSRAAHAANLRQFFTNTRALTSQSALPMLLSGYNRRPAADGTLSDYVRMAENDVGDDANVYSVQTLDYELRSDLIHLSTTGFGSCATRLQTVFGTVLTGGAYRRGPKITGMSYAGSNVTVTLSHRGGTDITPTTAIAGFTITDSDSSGVAPTISSATRTSATQITLACNRTLVAPVVKYLSGSAPVQTAAFPPSNEVFDNGTTALPMTVETVMATTSANTLATTVTFTVKADAAGTAVPDTTGLDYAFYDSPRISAGQAPIKYGSTLAITGGSVTIDITGLTALSPGGTGRIVYGPADGSKIAGGQVTVS